MSVNDQVLRSAAEMTDLAEHGFPSTELAGVAAVIEHDTGRGSRWSRAINARREDGIRARVHHRYSPELVAATACADVDERVSGSAHGGAGLDAGAHPVAGGMESLFQVAAVERDRTLSCNAILRAMTCSARSCSLNTNASKGSAIWPWHFDAAWFRE